MSVARLLISKSFREQSIYRSNVIMGLLGSVLFLFFQICLWFALYQSGRTGVSTLAETLTYLVFSSILLPTLQLGIGRQIGDAVYSGDLGSAMLRPISLQRFYMLRELGGAAFHLCTVVVPVLYLATRFFDFLPPAGLPALLAFLATAVLGAVIYNLYDIILGYSAFWLMTTWYMPWFKRVVFQMFGGVMIPLWFYPKILVSIAAYLPFQHIVYTPIELYLGRMPAESVFSVLALQLLWIALLWLIERLVWRLAQKKITVQGG